MDVDKKLLDDLFLPFFRKLNEDSEVGLLELNWYYDHQRKVGALTKAELEYVINKQIHLGLLDVISITQYRVTQKPKINLVFSITQDEIKNAFNEYANDFSKKYHALQNT